MARLTPNEILKLSEPVMQFSASPWRVLPEADFQKVKDALALREKCLPEILKGVAYKVEVCDEVYCVSKRA